MDDYVEELLELQQQEVEFEESDDMAWVDDQTRPE